MKIDTKYRIWITATFVFLIAIIGIAICDATLIMEDGWRASLVLLSGLLFASALFAFLTLRLLLLGKPWVMRTYGIFSLLWVASGISYGNNIVVMSESETERIVWLAVAIIVPILLGVGLVHKTLSVRNSKA